MVGNDIGGSQGLTSERACFVDSKPVQNALLIKAITVDRHNRVLHQRQCDGADVIVWNVVCLAIGKGDRGGSVSHFLLCCFRFMARTVRCCRSS